MCVNHTDRSMACSCLSPSLLSSLFPTVSLCVSLSVPSAFTSLMLFFSDIPHLHKHAHTHTHTHTHTQAYMHENTLSLPSPTPPSLQSDTSQQHPAATVHWLSDPSALLSRLGTVNATQKYMRDLTIEIALSLKKKKKREAEQLFTSFSLC